MHANGFKTIFQEWYVRQHSWKIIRNAFACMVVLQSMWKGPNHCWNFMESGSESATYTKKKWAYFSFGHWLERLCISFVAFVAFFGFYIEPDAFIKRHICLWQVGQIWTNIDWYMLKKKSLWATHFKVQVLSF